jgi:hypothetical protein
MSKIEVNQISSQCGSTLTIGQSGDTIQLACGATQTGFGRTGTVDWDTTAKTASFTAVSGNGYFVNTTSGAITVTLPSSPSAGDIVAIKDYANTADTNAITIARNGSNIDGTTIDATIANEGGSITLVYVDGTKGWLITDAAQKSDLVFPSYIVATGGTVTCCGDYKIHTFTGPGTFTVSFAGNAEGSNTVDYLVVAGGGAGGTGNNAGGGGAGGYRESSGAASGCYTASPLGACVSALPVSAQAYPITVGGGGTAGCKNTPPDVRGGKGSNSIFSTITSTGGGGGAVGDGTANGTPGTDDVGEPGGSGGGGGYQNYCNSTSSGGTGNTPPVSPPQGNNGGSSFSGAGGYGASGGGGAGAAGTNGSPVGGQPGGNGVSTSITGSSVTRGGGGGGGTNGPTSSGGTGGGGAGAPGSPCGPAGNGTANTGGGGGGGSCNTAPSGQCNAQGGSGGSGIVIIRYKYQ